MLIPFEKGNVSLYFIKHIYTHIHTHCQTFCSCGVLRVVPGSLRGGQGAVVTPGCGCRGALSVHPVSIPAGNPAPTALPILEL